ncbi:hypothetical protein IID19_05755 [Patescibacteria group bacterium]|nr:hypothetical protein [Patescibacteria group bacterium]
MSSLIQVIEYQGSLLPTSQLYISEAENNENQEGCPGRHWHGNATALDGKDFTDPDRACGYGTVEEKPAFSVYPPSQQ